jgi:hypothetical protein
MTIVMPSLSEDGWVEYAGSQLDYAFSHFFLSDYSQTYIYTGAVSSFAWVLEESNGDYSKCQNLLTVTLQNYLNRYFKSSTIDCSVKPSLTNPSQGEIYLYVAVVDHHDKEHVLGKMITYADNHTVTVININNYGNTMIPANI